MYIDTYRGHGVGVERRGVQVGVPRGLAVRRALVKGRRLVQPDGVLPQQLRHGGAEPGARRQRYIHVYNIQIDR